jgi:hypothetical protein
MEVGASINVGALLLLMVKCFALRLKLRADQLLVAKVIDG